MVSLGLPPYHVFTLEEMEEATNSFDPTNLVGEGSQGQVKMLIHYKKQNENDIYYYILSILFVILDVERFESSQIHNLHEYTSP